MSTHISLLKGNPLTVYMDYKLSFGKYTGKTIEEVFAIDHKYLDWICNKSINFLAAKAIHEYITTKKQEIINKYTVESGRYSLGPLKFKTKIDAKKMISEWLHTSYTGYIPSDEEMQWIIPLLQMHPRFEEKGGLMMTGVNVTYSPPAYHLNMILENDNTVDISYNKCLVKSANSQRNAVMKALRDIIRPQIASFKANIIANGDIRCAITDKILDSSELHIDHNFDILPFRTIVDNFMSKENRQIDDIRVVSRGITHDLEDTDLHDRWYKYHESVAILRPLQKHVNMKELSDEERIANGIQLN